MEIRYVTEGDDLLEISGIYERSWKYAYKDILPQDYLDSIPEGKWVSGIGKPGMSNLVATEAGKMIGTASFCRSRRPAYSEYGEIVSIYLAPDYIGKGYGGPLLGRCVEELHRLGFGKVLLWVLEGNRRARGFYQKNGFVCSGVYRDDNIGGRDVREVLYLFE